jgi:hypothetical protein
MFWSIVQIVEPYEATEGIEVNPSPSLAQGWRGTASNLSFEGFIAPAL